MTEPVGQSTDALLEGLRQAGRAPALDLIRACLQEQDALSEGLLQMLATNPFEAYGISRGKRDHRLYAPVHAGYLLTAFHETQALPLIIDIFRDEERGYLIEWFIAAVYDYGQPAIEPFSELVQDKEAFDYSRAAATEVLSRIGRLYPKLSDEVIGHLLAVLPADLEAGELSQLPRTGEEIWTWALLGLADLGADQILPRARPLFDKGLVDPDIAGTWEEYEERVASPASEVRSFNILDTYRYLHVQAQQEAIKRQADAEERGRQSAEHERVEPGGPTVRAEPKVGRNDPCPCGSGKKYKRCHGRPGR